MAIASTAEDGAWNPLPGPQTEFLCCDTDEALYGGAAGGGKSESLLVDALGVDLYKNRNYQALLMRRTFPDLKRSLIERSRDLYDCLGAKYNTTDHVWRFPSGAKIWFGAMEHENDRENYKSAEFQYIGLDEATLFTAGQIRYMLTRLRSSKGIHTRFRQGTNPGGISHDFILERYAPWLRQDDPEYSGPTARPGDPLWFLTDSDGVEKIVPRGTRYALSRTFIGARATDNPYLSDGYIANLMSQDPVTRAQLLDGNWMARSAPGEFFKPGWWKYIDEAEVPAGRTVTFWDRAATEENDPSTGKPPNDPDFTCGVTMRLTFEDPARIIVMNVRHFRAEPGEVKRRVKQAAEDDGREYGIRFGVDPGSAGKFEFADWVQTLMGWDVDGKPENGDKITRAKPYSAQVHAGNVYLVRAPWNRKYTAEHEAFPTKGIHDDQVDASSGAFAELTGDPVAKLPANFIRRRKSLRGD